MATVSVVRYQRKKKIGDDKSPMVYVLKPKPGESKLYSIESLAREIESIGSLSVEDVEHVMQSFVRSMKKVLVAGNKVKVDGLGIFYTTLTCPGVEQEKDCTVRNITRVNLRFKVDNSLRLANDSTATTRGGIITWSSNSSPRMRRLREATVMAEAPVVAAAAAPVAVPVPVAMEGRRKLPILPFSPVSVSASLMCTTCK